MVVPRSRNLRKIILQNYGKFFDVFSSNQIPQNLKVRKIICEMDFVKYYHSYVRRLVTTLRDKSLYAKHTIYSRKNKKIKLKFYLNFKSCEYCWNLFCGNCGFFFDMKISMSLIITLSSINFLSYLSFSLRLIFIFIFGIHHVCLGTKCEPKPMWGFLWSRSPLTKTTRICHFQSDDQFKRKYFCMENLYFGSAVRANFIT